MKIQSMGLAVIAGASSRIGAVLLPNLSRAEAPARYAIARGVD
jgi:hypothetical protein